MVFLCVFQCFPCIHCLYVTSFLHGEAEELLLKRDFEEVQSKGCRIEEEGAATNCHSCPPKGVSSRFAGFHDSIDSKSKGNTFGPKRSAHVGVELRFRTFTIEVEAKVGSLQLKVHVDLFCAFFGVL